MRRFLWLAAVLILAAALGLCVRVWGVGLLRVTGTSMDDTLKDGDIALVTRFDYRAGRMPAFGDVVECRFPKRADTYIKRVAGLPGETIAIAGGILHRNGQRVSEPYVSSFAENYGVTLGEHQYLLLGDNRRDSYDSRMPDMDPVDETAFIGRVRFIVWPLNRIGAVR